MREFLKKHLNSWDEICFDDTKRLRQNVILFTFTISVVFIIMSTRTALALSVRSAAVTLVLFVLTFIFFLGQFFSPAYSHLIAWLFGAMSLAMVALFVATGLISNTGHVWVYIMPIVGTMMVPLAETLVYNGMLMALLVLLLNTPLYEQIPAEYNPYFRAVFPISVLVVMICNYAVQYTRMRTQQHLLVATEKLRDVAFTDPLTGAYNRRALPAHFGEGHETAYGLSFAIMDLDHFKSVNDTYGHDAGDLLLCHLVALIRDRIPPNATLYRWGGEEFLLVLKSSDAQMLDAVLHDICTSVRETPLLLPSHSDGSLRATVSIGGMCAAQGDDITRAIKLADERMYRAKETGRDQVITTDA